MQLLTKDGRGVRLTATGRFLVAGSDTLIAEWESLRAAAMEAGDQVQSHFGLGGFSTAAAQLLAPLAATLRSTRPLLEVQVLEANPARCFDLLVAERIDLAVIVAMQSDTYGEDDPRFEQTVLLDDPLDVIIPADHPLASRETVTLEELASEPWITEAAGSTYHSLFTAAFTAVGVTPRIAHEAVEWETQIAFVGAGLGVGLLPRLAPLHSAENVVRLRITGQGEAHTPHCRRGAQGQHRITPDPGVARHPAGQRSSDPHRPAEEDALSARGVGVLGVAELAETRIPTRSITGLAFSAGCSPSSR